MNRQPDGRFAKGRSGNPLGRPPGIRNPRARQKARLRWAPELGSVHYALECALDGHPLALELCLPYLRLPRRRSLPIAFDLAPIRKAADATSAMNAIFAAMFRGELTPSETARLVRRVANRARAIEAAEGGPSKRRP